MSIMVILVNCFFFKYKNYILSLHLHFKRYTYTLRYTYTYTVHFKNIAFFIHEKPLLLLYFVKLRCGVVKKEGNKTRNLGKRMRKVKNALIRQLTCTN